MNIRAHLDTQGRVVRSLNWILGEVSAYPNGGTSEQPVRKMNTSLKVGDPVGLCAYGCNNNIM